MKNLLLVLLCLPMIGIASLPVNKIQSEIFENFILNGSDNEIETNQVLMLKKRSFFVSLMLILLLTLLISFFKETVLQRLQVLTIAKQLFQLQDQ
jgi:hypothetical protein